MLIPALGLSATGRSYTSIERRPVIGVDGSELAEATITPSILVNRWLMKPRRGLRELTTDQLLGIFRKAAASFATGSPDGLAPSEYVAKVSCSTGLPHAVVEESVRFLHQTMEGIGDVVSAQIPGGDVRIFDHGQYAARGANIGIATRARTLGVCLPGNHPSVNVIWLPALLMKVVPFLRPSSDDPFTAHRLTTALLEAGLPEDGIAFAPGDHDLADIMADRMPYTILFGDQKVLEKYRDNGRVKVYGPGRSKVLVPRAFVGSEVAVRAACTTALAEGGRACLSSSAVVVEGDAHAMAEAIAKVFSDIRPAELHRPDARLPAVASESVANAIDRLVTENLHSGAIDHTHPTGASRIARHGSLSFVLPTVISVPSTKHPLFGVELPFPFLVVAPVAGRTELLSAAQRSLAARLVGDDAGLVRELVDDPSIGQVHVNGLGMELDAREPHEGYLFDFLFEKKAVRRA